MAEVDIEHACEEVVRRHRGLWWKIAILGRRGCSDRLLILPDMPVVFIEMKAPGEEQSPLQKVHEQALVRRGQRYWLVMSAESLDERIRAYLALQRGLEAKPVPAPTKRKDTWK